MIGKILKWDNLLQQVTNMLFDRNRQRQGLASLNQPNQMAYDNANPNARFLNQQMPKRAQNQNMYSPFANQQEGMGLPTPVIPSQPIVPQTGGGYMTPPTQPVGVQQQTPYNRPMQRPMQPRINRRQMLQQRMRDPRFREMMRRKMMMRRRRPMGLSGLGRY